MLYTITAINGNEVTLDKQPPSTALVFRHLKSQRACRCTVPDNLLDTIINQEEISMGIGDIIDIPNPGMKAHLQKEGFIMEFIDGTFLTHENYESYRYHSNNDYNNMLFKKEELPEFMNKLSLTALHDYREKKALRYNEGKLRWSLVDWKSMEPMVHVLEFGASKYQEGNWKKPMDKKQILNSAMRHLIAMMNGEENDPESGLPHAGHVHCNMMFYSYHSQNNDSK